MAGLLDLNMTETRSKYPIQVIQSSDLTQQLGDWTTRGGPLYARLADAIADCVAYGVLTGGRLPAERDLAGHLGLSRGTVVSAYDALRVRDLARSIRGSGTFINAAARADTRHEAPIFSRLVASEQAPIDLSVAALQTPELLADTEVRLSDALRMFPRHGYAPLGAPALRAAIAGHLTASGRTGATEPHHVLVTAGGQGALSLIAAGLIRAGDRVLVEAPTYPGAIEIFARAGARIEPIERDHAGLLTGQLEQALAGGPVRMLFLVPTCHNPTGTHMSEKRRREVLRVAAEWRLTVVEDTTMADLSAEPPPPDLSAIAPERVISVGSLSKSYWAGLRIGWIRAAPDTVQRLGRLRAAVDLGGPLLEQAMAVPIFTEFERVTAPTRAARRERLAVLVDELRARLPEWSFDEPRGGWSVWVALPWGSADHFAQLALRHGVAVAPGGSMSPDDRYSGHLRISAGAAPEQLVRGVELLARAWDQMAAEGDRGAEAISLPV
jgi:DNA-binding transcriptional MocR family regulator